MKKILAITAFILLSLGFIQAQDITISAPETIPSGEMFHLKYEVNGYVSDYRINPPAGISILSQSSSSSGFNGRYNSRVECVAVAEKEGTYTIPGATFLIDRKKVQSKSVTITVTKPDAALLKKRQQQQQQQRQQQQQQQLQMQQRQKQINDQYASEIDSKSLFARASVSKQNPYQGEQVIITYKIYTQVSLQQFQIDKLPGNKGFWSEDLSTGKQVRQSEETLDGKRYLVAEIRRGALFAQESGNARIAPLELDVLAMVPRKRQRTGTIWDLFDDPFFNPAQAVEKHLSTNSINVNVKALPPAPDGYIGGVGHFDISDKADLNEVRANEAVTYTVTINGSGNLMLINAPEINFSQNVEVYDPETEDKINRNDSGISGSRTFKWILIPRSEGTISIPETQICYFDPKTGTYVTKTIGGFEIKVKPGDPKSMQNVSNKSDIKRLNSDINHIKTKRSRLVKDGEGCGSLWFWIIMIVEVIAAAAAILIGKRRAAQEQDIVGTRLRRATKEARKRLKKAEAFLKNGNDNQFYEEIYKAIWGCLADKFNIELSQLSRETVQDCLVQKNVPEEHQKHILDTLNDVDFARFAPGDKSAIKQQIYDKALQMTATL